MNHRARRRPATALALVALVAACRIAAASVVPWMGLQEMTAKADVIVLGTVESAEATWNDSGRMIVTRATVLVERALKGGPRARVIVEAPGGRVGDLTMVAPGSPVFRAGDRLVLFLEPAGARHGVVGWNQGRMTVRRDPASGRDIVDDHTSGTLYLDAQGKPVADNRAGRGPAELGRFLAEVDDLVAGHGRRSAP